MVQFHVGRGGKRRKRSFLRRSRAFSKPFYAARNKPSRLKRSISCKLWRIWFQLETVRATKTYRLMFQSGASNAKPRSLITPVSSRRVPPGRARYHQVCLRGPEDRRTA